MPSGFTATVNAEMRVSSLEETVTVTGSSPVVDVQTTTQALELSKSLLDVLPTGRAPHNFAQAIPGVTGVNLGGFATGRDANRLAAYGSSSYEATLAIDGDKVYWGTLVGGPGVTTRANPAMVGEISVVTTGGTAQKGESGVQINLIPKEGGNQFSGYVYSMFTNSTLQASNVTSGLKAQGVGPTGIVKQWDVDPAFGGPLKRDVLWFFGSVRNSQIEQYRPGLYENATPGTFVYTNNDGEPSTATIIDPDYSGRLTWQATRSDKFRFYASTQPRTMNLGFELSTVSNEATSVQTYPPNRILQAGWQRPVGHRLLLDAGWTRYDIVLNNTPQPGTSATNPNTIALTEQTTGLQFGSPQAFQHSGGGMWTYHGSASLITGSQSVKVGFSIVQQDYSNFGFLAAPHGDITYQLRNSVPNLLTEYAPVNYDAHIKCDCAIYVQDQWTRKRLTLNIGLRYEYLNGWNSAVTEPASTFVGARSFPGTADTPNWKDVNPRTAVAFDLFGDGKTALKFSLGRYDTQMAAGAATQASPAAVSIQSASRTWNDTTDSYTPNCNLTNPGANGQCGTLANAYFGSDSPSVATVDPAVLRGFDVRPYQWETAASLEHQLAQGWSLTASYIRRSFANFTVTQNLTVTPADYDPYCITAPADPRLPGGGGNQICGLYDVKPQYFGIATQSIITSAARFGNDTQIYNGFSVSTNARFADGVQLLGGLTVGRTVTNQCFIVNTPQDLRFCEIAQPFQPLFKMTAIFPPVWHIDTTVLYQTLPGGQSNITSSPYNTNNGIQANDSVTSAQIAPSLGRNLAAGANATVTIPLITPDTLYTPRQHMVSVRFTRAFQAGRFRIVPGIEVDNLLNASTAFSVNNTYGPAWQAVNQIMNPLNVQFNAQLTF